MARAFVHCGIWRGGRAEARCDAALQQRATFRVSALAGAVTLALLAGPGFDLGAAEQPEPRRPAVGLPEIVAVKPVDRVPMREASLVRTPPAAVAAPEPQAGIEIVDAATLRAGAMTVRLAGIALPAPERSCRRLDGLAVPCLDRAASYLELLVRSRTVACDRAGTAADGVELGRCRIGEADVAEQMVRQGWVEAADKDDARLAAAEAAARKQRLGLWRD